MRSHRTIRLVSLTITVACLFAAFGAVAAQATLTPLGSFGSTGDGPGQFSSNSTYSPSGLAVNFTTGDLYVADFGNHRIQQFTEDGTFIRMWGGAVNQTTGGDVCPVNPGDICGAGSVGGGAGFFNGPDGIGVDNSDGPAAGSVYVQDSNNRRIQRFTASGEFVLTWGKGVDLDTGGNFCTAVSGHSCVAGAPSGNPGDPAEGIPATPSGPGEFFGWGSVGEHAQYLAVDPAGYVYVAERVAVPHARVQKFDSSGSFLGQIAGPAKEKPEHGVGEVKGLAVDSSGKVYAIRTGYFFGPAEVHVFDPSEFSLTGESAAYSSAFSLIAPTVVNITLDPANEFLLSGADNPGGCGVLGGPKFRIAEFHRNGQLLDCTDVPGVGIGNTGGLVATPSHKLYVADSPHQTIHIFELPVAAPPAIAASQLATEITTNKVVIKSEIVANLSDTTYHLEYGTSPCSSNACASTPESSSIGASLSPAPIAPGILGLAPDTKYYYRVVASNGAGTDESPDRSFRTFAAPSAVFDASCPNNLARQQTGAAFLLDCRAYELVSAENTGGYNVESDLIPGQTPFQAFPNADGKVLYAIHNGGIPGTGKPTNRGPDPYVASRDDESRRWSTTYVGIPADAPSAEPFSSTVADADQALENFAFGGPDICDPCFGDNSAGMPLRKGASALSQGMAGSIPVADPEPSGEVKKHFSADGTHFIFASKQQFEPEASSSGTDVTVYDRDLDTDATQVVSTLPDGSTIEAGDDVVALDISADGSRVLIGRLVSTDSNGNPYFDLFMHVGSSPESVEVADTSSGALYAGMSMDGSQVFFTSADSLGDDTDESADLFRADVAAANPGGTAAVERISTGDASGNTDDCDPAGNSFNSANWNVVPGGPTDCSVVAVGGGGGVSTEGGSAYFLSPEQLDGSGVEGAPNLYLAMSAESPRFIATLESSDNAPLKQGAHLYQRSFGSLDNPEGVAIDEATGATYVLDNLNTAESPGAFVQKFDAEGNPDASFGTASKISESPSGPFLQFGDGSALGSTFGAPASIAVDNNPTSPNYRDIYVPDTARFAVHKFDSNGNYISTIEVPDYVFGVGVDQYTGNVYATSFFGNAYVFGPDGAPTAPTSFSITGFVPQGIAIDSSANSYVTDGSVTKKYDSTGAFLEVFDPNPSYGVSIDRADGHIYIDEGTRIVEFDASGTQVGTTFGSGVLSGSVGLAAASGRVIASNGGNDNVAEFGAPATPPDRGYDNQLVIDSVRSPATRHSEDFQTTPSGRDAVFVSTLPLTDLSSDGNLQIFRYDALTPGAVDCVSCNTTEASPDTDASLPAHGLGITDEGRIFFDTGEPLVLRDTNSRRDAYEWSDGKVQLISTGSSSFDSGLLSVSADGKDAFFYTREVLAATDENGSLMKIYDAREGGGLFTVPPPPPCAASDECHGPSSQAAAPVVINSAKGSGGNSKAPLRCRRGQVKRSGKCVRRKRRGATKRASRAAPRKSQRNG